MGVENGTVSSPRAVAEDSVTFREAGAKLGRSAEWIRTLVKDGRLRVLGTQTDGASRPARLVSLKEATVAVEKATNGRGGRKKVVQKKKSKTPTSEGKRMLNARTRKAAGVTQFVKEEIRDFAQTIMEGMLDCSSITIIARGDGGFDVSTTPRTPATRAFKV